jgi:glycosyltransferase involved in cell wall biosynthesis
MRILHVTKKYPHAIGGDATCVFHLEKQQALAGHKVFILAANCPEIVDKPNLYKFGLSGVAAEWDKVSLKRVVSLFLLFFTAPLALRKARPEIIHTHAADLGFIVSLWAKAFKIPVIHTCHGITFPYRFFGLLKRIPEFLCLKFAFFDKIITVDKSSLPFFKKYGLRKYVYQHICGVDIDEFRKAKAGIQEAAERRKTRFIFVGRMDPFKGLEYLLQAAAELKKKNPAFEVWIIGDGPLKKELSALTFRLGLKEEVTFFGAITDRKRLMEKYCAADIFVLPSVWEGFPIVILEAWAAGLAVIATDACGINALCVDKENALFCIPGDVASLHYAMAAVTADKDLRLRLAKNGNRLAMDNYTWSQLADKLGIYYSQLLERRSDEYP